MPNVIVRRPRTEQPQGPVPLRKELYENLLGYFPNSGNDLPTYPLTFAGNAAYGVTEFGRATLFDGNGDYTSAGDAFYSDEYTILVTVNANLLDTNARSIIAKRNIGIAANVNEIWLYASATSVVFYCWNGSTSFILTSSGFTPVAGETFTVGLDIPPGTGTAYMYINGVQVASGSKTFVISNSNTELQFACRSNGDNLRYWNGYIGQAVFWGKQLPNTQELTANPWAILEDEEFPVWFSTGAGPTLVNVADSLTPSLTETQGSFLTTTVADTITPSLTETAALFKNPEFISVTDTFTISLTDAVTLFASTVVSDTLTPSLTDTAALDTGGAPVAVAVSDSLTPSLAETTAIQAGIAVTDLLTPSLTETQASLIYAAVTEALTISLGETLGSFVASSVTDVFTVSVSEAVTLIAAVTVTETFLISLTDTASVVSADVIAKTVSDTLAPYFTEVASFVALDAWQKESAIVGVWTISGSVSGSWTKDTPL